jgi:hypothetical protein
VFVAIGAMCLPCAVYGQFTDARTYANTPVGVNQLELDYAHSTAELGVSHPFGSGQKWVADGYFFAYFFTDNTEYHGREILRQEPLPGLEAHISYNLTSNLWVSLDANYGFRGTTFVDRVDQYDAQKNLTVGGQMYWTVNSRNSLASSIRQIRRARERPDLYPSSPQVFLQLESRLLAIGSAGFCTGLDVIGRSPGGASPR